MIDRDIDLNNIYAWNYNLLKFMGIWPEERKWNRSSSYLVLFPFLTMVCFACGPQTINLSIIAGDSDLVIENLSNNITFMVSIMKTLTVWINGIRKYFRKLINTDLSFLLAKNTTKHAAYKSHSIILFYHILLFVHITF